MGLIKSSVYPAMQLSHKHSRPEGSVPMVCLGWHTAKAGEQEVLWHNGGTGGYRSFAGFINGGTKGVVVLTNSTASVDDIGMHVLHPKAPLISANPPAAIKEITVDTETLETYVGQYEMAPGMILTVSRDGSQLKAQLTNQPQFPVFAKETNVFFFKVVQAELMFNKNAEGKVDSVTLFQGGQQVPMKKLAK